MSKRTASDAFSDQIKILMLRKDLERSEAALALADKHCMRYQEILETDDNCVCCEACGQKWREAWFGVVGNPDWCAVCDEFWCADCTGGTAKCGCTGKDTVGEDTNDVD